MTDLQTISKQLPNILHNSGRNDLFLLYYNTNGYKCIVGVFDRENIHQTLLDTCHYILNNKRIIDFEEIKNGWKIETKQYVELITYYIYCRKIELNQVLDL